MPSIRNHFPRNSTPHHATPPHPTRRTQGGDNEAGDTGRGVIARHHLLPRQRGRLPRLRSRRLSGARHDSRVVLMLTPTCAESQVVPMQITKITQCVSKCTAGICMVVRSPRHLQAAHGAGVNEWFVNLAGAHSGRGPYSSPLLLPSPPPSPSSPPLFPTHLPLLSTDSCLLLCLSLHQLIRLSEHPAATGSYVEEMERFVNLGPIVDMAVVDLDRQGQGQLVTCSGAFGDGSLRVVRNGIGINEQATVELEGIKGMWSLRRGTWEEHDTLLVVTFVSETRSLAINDQDELDETDVLGFDEHAQTLFCGNVVHDQIVQVTSSELRLVNAHTLQQVTEWRAPAGASINVATANLSQVLLATGGGTLVYVEVGEGTLTERTHVTLEHEIACLDVTPITDDNAMADGTVPVAALAAVGMWTDMSVRVLRLPGLEEVHKEVLGGDIIPRSVLMCCLEQVPYLLCALGDGHLFNFHLDRETGQLSDRKKVSLGTQPMALRTFRSRDATHVFAASDRPTVVHSSNRKLLYSNVNLKEVTHMCSFNCASFPD
ncbi:unnamed protein product, partial [Closterium sp. NIES-53]